MARRLISFLLLAVMVSLPLAGCGKKSLPEVPEDSTYPKRYPKE